MKKYNLFIVIIFLLIACNKNEKTQENKTNKSPEITKLELHALVDTWHKAASDANFDSYFSLMDSTSYFLGTDASENWEKSAFKQFSKPFFDKGKAWDFKTIERNMYLNEAGDLAWFDELLQTWMGTCRGSGVIILTDKAWKIKHYVLSVCIPNETINEVIKVKSEDDALFLRNRKVK